MEKEKVSILMPVYNGEKFIASSVESVLNQSFRNFEFIIIDDASLDNSLSIINSYKDSRIRMFSNDFNIGQTRTLNKAIGLAQGEFVARMDQDDVASRERLEEQVNFFRRHNEISAVGTSAIIINGTAEKIGRYNAITDEAQLKLEILFNNPIVHSSVMLRREILLELGGYNEDYIFAQDYELWSRILAAGHKIGNIKKPLISLRMHKNSATVLSCSDRFEIETARIIKNNISYLAGIEISLDDAARICQALYKPCILSDKEFGDTVEIFDTIFWKFKYGKEKPYKRLDISIAKFKYILALGYMERGDRKSARLLFIDAFESFPFKFEPLVSYFFSLFGRKALEKARLLRKAVLN